MFKNLPSKRILITAIVVIVVTAGSVFILYKSGLINQDETVDVDVDWAKAEIMLPVLNNNLDVYQRNYSSTADAIKKEKKFQQGLLGIIAGETDPTAKQSVQDFYDLSVAYTDAGDTLLDWLNTAATYYHQHLAAIKTKNGNAYLSTEELIDEHELNKDELLGNFMATRKTREEAEEKFSR